MSTNLDDIQIDLDEIDRKNAESSKKTSQKDPAPAGEVSEPVVKADEKPKTREKPVVKPEEGIEDIQKQLADEKAARELAERRAREASEGEAKAKTDAQSNQLALITNAIENLNSNADLLESRYADALAAGDHSAAAKIQREMAKVETKLFALEQGKAQLERAPRPEPRTSGDPVEEFTKDMTPRSAAWVRAHPEYVRNPRLNAKMIAAHNFIKDDVVVDSDEYFGKIEEMLGLKKPEPIIKTDDVDPMADAAKPVKKAPPPAAPVTRSGNGAGNRQNVVTLTAEQREAARESGLTDEEYARNMIALQREGRLQ